MDQWNKQNKPGSANLAGGGGLPGLGDDPVDPNIERINKQRQYALELEAQVQVGKSRKEQERQMDRQLYGGGGEADLDAKNRAKRLAQMEYAEQLKLGVQQQGQQNRASPRQQQFSGLGDYEDELRQGKRAKQEAYARVRYETVYVCIGVYGV